jgi:hypothetical protein
LKDAVTWSLAGACAGAVAAAGGGGTACAKTDAHDRALSNHAAQRTLVLRRACRLEAGSRLDSRFIKV